MATPLTLTAVITNDCNFDCKYCIAGCTRPAVDRDTSVDFDALFKWVEEFMPGCNLHISGGEPLMHDELYDGAKALVEAEHKVTIFTNGSLLPSKPELLDLDVFWHVTHHRNEQKLKPFLKSIKPLKKLPHLICSVYSAEWVPDRKKAIKDYDGFNFKWMRLNCGYIDSGLKKDLNDISCIRTVGIHGEVYPCGSGKQDTIGSIYDMTYDSEAAKQFEPNIRTCIQSGDCGSYQSAALIHKLRCGL